MSSPVSASVSSAAAAAQAASASCCQVVIDYINKIIASVPGMKSLLLDVETVSIVGLVYPLSEIIQKEVYYVDRLYTQAPSSGYGLDDERKQKDEASMQHLKAVAYIRPCQTSIDQLKTLLKSNRYKEYYIFFSNTASDDILRSLAAADTHELIRQVQEFYGDLYAVSRTCFHFDQYKSRPLYVPPSDWATEQKTIFERNVQGVLATFLAFKKRPEIRYTASSEVTKIMAHEMMRRMKEEADLFTFQGEPPLLLILDRRDDPLTPLLMQWTYQAMVHEILGIHHNRVDMKHVKDQKADLREVVLSPEQDHFFRGSQFLNFGDLGQSIKDLVQDYQRKSHTNTKMESIEDMQRFVEAYPEFRQMAGNVSKHVALVSELSKQIETRKLLNVSELEQELACNQDHGTALENVMRMLEDPRVMFYDKLRLVLLYALRYEDQRSQLPQLRNLLRDKAHDDMERRQVIAVDELLRFAGAKSRGGDLFGNKTVFNMAKRFVTGLKGVENIYTQHKPLLSETLNYLLQQRLKTSHFPYVDTSQNGVADKKRYRLIFIYMMGGCTMSELALLEALNLSEATNGVRLILGGSCIHNSRTFITDAANFEPELLSSTIGSHSSHTSHHRGSVTSSSGFRGRP